MDDNLKIISLEIGELTFEKQLLIEKISLLISELKYLKTRFDRYKFDTTSYDIDLSNLKESLQDPSHREYLKFIYTYQYDIFPEKKILNEINQRIKLRDENNNLLRTKVNTILIKNNQSKNELRAFEKF